tara:strand:+ start:100179 stop:101180 length:1002 start_codon:yes stop_codon:yes gene_type:complete
MLKKILLIISLLMSCAYAENSAVFIMYHRFGESRYPSTNVTLPQFQAQMHELNAGGYHVMPVPDIITALKSGKPLPNNTVGITIDDAYESVYTKAWPILQHYHFPFTLFVATGPIDKRFGDMMTWPQIKALAKAGVTIGNHTDTHTYLINGDIKQAQADIEKSQQRLNDELGQAPSLFAYPFGESSPALQRVVKNLGFTAAFSQVSGAAGEASDYYALPRFPLNEHYSDMDRFQLITKTKPLIITQLKPKSNLVVDNPPQIQFTVDKNIDTKKLACYATGQGRVVLIIAQQHIRLMLNKLTHRRTHINCTVPTTDGHWRWLGLMYTLPTIKVS